MELVNLLLQGLMTPLLQHLLLHLISGRLELHSRHVWASHTNMELQPARHDISWIVVMFLDGAFPEMTGITKIVAYLTTVRVDTNVLHLLL